MKKIFAIVMTVSLLGCGDESTTERIVPISGPQGEPGPIGPQGQPGTPAKSVGPTTVVLTASKEYAPTKWNNAAYILANKSNVEIPSIVPVVRGSAGNHALYIQFGDVVCKYQGGADVSKPLSPFNSLQVEKGRAYLFNNCNDGSEAGELIQLEAGQLIEVEVNHGDTTLTTTVQASFLMEAAQ